MNINETVHESLWDGVRIGSGFTVGSNLILCAVLVAVWAANVIVFAAGAFVVRAAWHYGKRLYYVTKDAIRDRRAVGSN